MDSMILPQTPNLSIPGITIINCLIYPLVNSGNHSVWNRPPILLPFFAMTSHPPSSSSTLPPSQLSTETLRNLLEPVTIPSSSPEASFINWGLSYTCKPAAVFQPETEEQCALIVELARRDGQPVRAAGVGHSPSDLACTGGYMLRTEKLSKVIEVSRTCQHPYVRKKSEAVSETSCCLHPMFRYLSYFCLTAISGSDYCMRSGVRHHAFAI